MKETLIKFSNRRLSELETIAVQEALKIVEYKSISAGQPYQSVWKNPLVDILKDTETEQNCSKIVNPKRLYDIVYIKS